MTEKNERRFRFVTWDKQKISEYWETYKTISLLSADFFSETASGWLLSRVTRFLPSQGEVLDVGFGSGKLLLVLAQRGYTCYGIDTSASNLEILRTRAKETGIRIDARLGEISSIPFEDEKFDVVFAVEVLEHLLDSDLTQGLDEVRRVLKPGGTLIVTTPYRERIGYELCPDCHAVFQHMQHLRSFDENSLKVLLSGRGFTVKSLEKAPIIMVSGGKLIRTLKLKLLTILLNKVGLGKTSLLSVAVK